MPIYFVICEWISNPSGYGIYRILETIECTLNDVIANRVNTNKWYNEAVSSGQGVQIQAYMFEREPPNPFRKEDQPPS